MFDMASPEVLHTITQSPTFVTDNSSEPVAFSSARSIGLVSPSVIATTTVAHPVPGIEN